MADGSAECTSQCMWRVFRPKVVHQVMLVWILYLLSQATSDNFTIGFLPAKTNSDGVILYGLGAFTLALEKINHPDCELLRGHQLNYYLRDNMADTRQTIVHMTDLYTDKDVDVFIGPDETCRTEALIASAWNLPMIAYVSVFLVHKQCSSRVWFNNHICQ